MDATERIERLAAAVERLAAAIEGLQRSAFSIQHSAADLHDRATGGSERIGTAVAQIGTGLAFERSFERSSVVPSKQENSRSFGRSLRTNERTGFSWEKLTTDEMANEEVTRSKGLSMVCERIAKIVPAKPGRWWRQDRMLHVVAAVLASRIDRVSRSEIGSDWLNDALREVKDFRPQNSAAYFQDALKRGLSKLDPVFRDETTARMAWIRLCQTVRVPEIWLEERPPGQPRAERRA